MTQALIEIQRVLSEANAAGKLTDTIWRGPAETLFDYIQNEIDAAAPQAAVPVVRGEVLVTVSGFTGSGKSAIAGEIEIMCRALGLQVEWPDGVTEKNMTHADWTTALELYNPRVRIVERNVPRNTASGADQ